jgi:hypothetical protein
MDIEIFRRETVATHMEIVDRILPSGKLRVITVYLRKVI